MSKHALIGCLVISIGIPAMASAQGTLRVSNIGQTPTGNGLIGSDSWIAQEFAILLSDPNEYTLDSVQLLMNPASGNPSDFEASIYSGPPGTIPETFLGNLTGSDDPSAGGVYSYTSSGITLSRGIGYFVVVTSSTPVAQGAYDWSASDSFTLDGTWAINNQHATSPDGSNWQLFGRGNEVFQVGVYATVVPEPSSFALLGFGSLVMAMVMRRG